MIPFDNLSECVPDDYRVLLGYAMEFWWTGGTLFATGAASIILPATWGGWRIFLLASSFPILLALLGAVVLDESPAWLVDVGRTQEAEGVLRKAAIMNKKPNVRIKLLAYEREAESSVKELFTPALRRRTFSLSMLWCLGFFGYYGASLANGFIFDDGNDIDYGEVLFASSGECLGVILALAACHWCSGMQILAVSYFLGTVGCLGILIISLLPGTSPKMIKAVLAFVLRVGVMSGSSAVWVITPAAFPTAVRATAHSVVFAAGRVGGLLATLWPSTVPVAVVMGAYAAANAICSCIGISEGRVLESKGAFQSLASDLHATNLGRRAQSLALQSERLSTATRGRPSIPSPF